MKFDVVLRTRAMVSCQWVADDAVLASLQGLSLGERALDNGIEVGSLRLETWVSR